MFGTIDSNALTKETDYCFMHCRGSRQRLIKLAGFRDTISSCQNSRGKQFTNPVQINFINSTLLPLSVIYNGLIRSFRFKVFFVGVWPKSNVRFTPCEI